MWQRVAVADTHQVWHSVALHDTPRNHAASHTYILYIHTHTHRYFDEDGGHTIHSSTHTHTHTQTHTHTHTHTHTRYFTKRGGHRTHSRRRTHWMEEGMTDNKVREGEGTLRALRRLCMRSMYESCHT